MTNDASGPNPNPPPAVAPAVAPAPVATPAPAPPPPETRRADTSADQVIIYQHSSLFYWWPVWFFGFAFALLSWWGDYHMAIVPPNTVAVSGVAVDIGGKSEKRDVLVLDKDRKHLTRPDDNGAAVVVQPTVHVSRHRSMGTVYLIILLIVTLITNVPLRGLWSVVAIVSVLGLSVIFWILGWWESIFDRLGNLSIYINLGGYLLLSLVLFVMWLTAYFLLDRQMYVVFTPGQVRMCLEIGGGETIYDTLGMTVQKQKSDPFRHLILGFGSGDLLLRFAKIEHPIELHNVLHVHKLLEQIDRMVTEKVMVSPETTSDARRG